MLIALCLSIAQQQDLPKVTAQHEFVWASAATHGGLKQLAIELCLPVSKGSAFPVVLVVDPSGAGALRERAQAATIEALLARGIAVASTTIRTGDEAEFPAQVQDLKGSVRYLRANATRLGLDPGRIGVWGEGDGATLAALLGTSGNVAGLEGSVGGNAGVSSRVQAVVEISGLLDLEDELVSPGLEGVRTQRLVGVSPSMRDLARSNAGRRAADDARHDGSRSIDTGSIDMGPIDMGPIDKGPIDKGPIEVLALAASAAPERSATATSDEESARADSHRDEVRLATSDKDENPSTDAPHAAPSTGRVALAFTARARVPGDADTRRSDSLDSPSGRVSAPEIETIAPSDALRYASPLRHVSADDPPMFLAEALAPPGAAPSQARAMRKSLLLHGVTTLLAEWPLGQSGVGAERLPRTTLASAAEFARSVLVNSCSIAPIGSGSTNSLGTRAMIWSTGLATPTTPFWLHVDGALPNATGAFVFSEGPGGVRTAAGEVFVSAPLVRLARLTTDARGQATQALAIPEEWIGRTLFFQFEYHDQGTQVLSGSGSVFSAGGRVTICP